jgi:hypothetical protein
MTDIIRREMAARLASIEDELSEYPANIRKARERFIAVRNSLYTAQAVIQNDGDTDVAALVIDMVQRQMYKLADALSALARLELTASDFGVMMALARSEVEENKLIEGELTPVNVYDCPHEAKERIA